MNTVILTSVLSAGNHALFAGTRVLYGLSVTAQGPGIFQWTTSSGVPLPALLATSSISLLCFGSSFVGSGELWGWLQNIVGVSNQIAWLSIGLASWRFRKAWIIQGRALSELKFRASWTWPWGPPFVVITVTALILIQCWSSIFPHFSAVDFVSLYIEIPVMAVMFLGWWLIRRPQPNFIPASSPVQPYSRCKWWKLDLVDVETVDLRRDEYEEDIAQENDEGDKREARWLRRVFYWVV
jgi:amino acid permease